MREKFSIRNKYIKESENDKCPCPTVHRKRSLMGWLISTSSQGGHPLLNKEYQCFLLVLL